MQLILYFGMGFAMLILVIGVVVSVREERSLVEDRLGKYLKEEQERKGPGKKRTTAANEWMNARIEKFVWGASIAKELARADIKLKIGEFLAFAAGVSVLIAVVAYVVSQGSLIFAAVGFIVGAFLPRVYVGRQKNKRLVRFNEQLADMLNLMVNGLRAGYSTMQAMEAVAKELPAPISDEFRRVVQEMQLGITMEAALDNLLRRIPSLDLDLVITAMNVQREVGGNLAEILSTISHTIRERVRVKGEIRVLTSQQVYSGRLLAIMPIVLLLLMYLLNREYVELFWTGETALLGYIALGAAAVLIAAGYFTMNRISNIEI
jgi:tight adherence protein B